MNVGDGGGAEARGNGASGAAPPRAAAERRLAGRRAAVARSDRSDAAVAGARLGAFVAAIAVAWLAFGPRVLARGWIAAPLVAYTALAAVHERVLRARTRARRSVAFHEAILARLDGRWAGRGEPGDRFATPDHPYALDLDVLGTGSLFELVCAARTRPGEGRLAEWLLAPAGPEEVRSRQRAIRCLTPRIDLREDLAVAGEDVRAGVDAEALARWSEERPALPRWLAPVAASLAAAAVAAAAAWARGAGPLPLAAVILAEWAVASVARGRVARTLAGLDRPAREMLVLVLLLGRLERERFDDPRLAGLVAAIAGPPAASARIAALTRHASRLDWARNQLFAPVAFLLMWAPLHAVLVERWRARSGATVRRWLDAVAELEALSSLAGYAWENPGDPFPEILPPAPDGRGRIEGEALCHPLLRGCVPNDVALGGAAPAVLLVSGSNMSGKSTYLRTVGTNVVLALAGAPVRAARLALTPVAIGATLRIQDSLQAGRSRFYAEISRVKQLDGIARGPVPLLFLLDELLHGTNSHDRRVGAEALLRGLAGHGAIGVVTTHDLALTELASGGAIANAHFEDQVKDGEIAFDYRLRPGVVAHSNALALMRAIGLEV